MVGAFGEEKPVTEQVESLAHALKAAVEAKLGRAFATWTPISYAHQVVAGTNYRVKVRAQFPRLPGL